MRGLPPALHGATVAHLTDLHAGFGGLEAVYDEAVQTVKARRPDLILFTGDYIDDHAPKSGYPIADLLRRFEAPMGVYGSLGNHDHRRGVEQARCFLAQADVHLLENANVRLAEGLWLAGLDDTHEGQPDLACTLEGLPDNQTSIILSHNPRLIEKIPDRDALILSGHTHGGQIALPFPSPALVCRFHLRCPQVAGWYENGRARLYVNRGLGVTGQPFRYRCPAEIAFFRLVPAPEKKGS